MGFFLVVAGETLGYLKLIVTSRLNSCPSGVNTKEFQATASEQDAQVGDLVLAQAWETVRGLPVTEVSRFIRC